MYTNSINRIYYFIIFYNLCKFIKFLICIALLLLLVLIHKNNNTNIVTIFK